MKLLRAAIFLGFLDCSGGTRGGTPRASDDGWVLSLDPPSALDAAQAVVAFVLSGQREGDAPTDPILVEGEPSKTSVGRYVDGETTESLAERIVPTQVEHGIDSLVLRPHHVLALGQRYAVLSRSGVLGSVVINPSRELTYLSRLWPPRDSTQAILQTIYCGVYAPMEPAQIALFPSEHTARLEPGLDGTPLALGSCVRVVPDAVQDQTVQPPSAIGNWTFEPTPWVVGAGVTEVAPLVCLANESSLGPGCLGFERGQAIVRAPASSTFWVLSSSLGWHLQTIEGGGRFSVPDLANLADGRLDALVFDLAGRSFASSIRVTAPEPTARVVINEVLANPLGPEPAEEWVELTNSGSIAADMKGWKLRDEAGEVEIPPLLLDPRAFVLLVREDFVGGVSGDVPPDANTTLVRLPALGKNGLSNSGEKLTLLDDHGLVVSTFPARPSDRAGVSLARSYPTALDDATGSFGPHANSGASPGTSNAVE